MSPASECEAKALASLLLLLAGLLLILQVSRPPAALEPSSPTPHALFPDLWVAPECARRNQLLSRDVHIASAHVLAPLPHEDRQHAATGAGNASRQLHIAVVSTTNDAIKRIDLWMQFHRAVGVSSFYLFVDGAAAEQETVAELRSRPGVKVFLKDGKLKWWHKNSRVWHETWLAAFFNRPCNSELFVKQTLNMEVAVMQAMADRVDWILHLDTDELLHPAGTATYDVRELLSSFPAEVDGVVLHNYEALSESDDVTEPFLACTLFKKSQHHLPPGALQAHYALAAHGNPNFFTTYSNGKSFARVQPGLRPNGAHRWNDYAHVYNEQQANQAAVLHYTYNRFDDLKSRRDRCNCEPTREGVERCFFLAFDRQAFIASSVLPEQELRDFFKLHLVWDSEPTITQLMRAGVLERIYTPQALLTWTPAATLTSRDCDDKGQQRCTHERGTSGKPPRPALGAYCGLPRSRHGGTRGVDGQEPGGCDDSPQRATVLERIDLPTQPPLSNLTSDAYLRTQAIYNTCILTFQEAYNKKKTWAGG